MPSSSGGVVDSPPSSPAPKAPYYCCSGLAYYTRAMQQQGAKPFCLGLRHVKDGVLKPDDAQNLPTGTQDYQFLCMGFSAHPVGDGTEGSRTMLPYCEGVELVSYTQAEAGSAVQELRTQGRGSEGETQPAAGASPSLQQRLLQERSAGAGASGGGGGGGAAPGPSEPPEPPEPERRAFAERFWARAAANADSMQKLMRNEGALQLRSFGTFQEVSQRLWEVGGQNSARVVAAAGFLRSSIAERCDVAWQAVCERIKK